jgi:hypothetical protein
MKMVNDQLPGILVAVPEFRKLDTMAVLLENRGADVLRVPLVAIHVPTILRRCWPGSGLSANNRLTCS